MISYANIPLKRTVFWLFVALYIILLLSMPSYCFAVEDESSGASGKLYGDEKIDVDILADQLKLAEADSMYADIKACAIRYRVNFLNARLPEQQKRSDKAARNLYKSQKASYGMLEMLLGSESLDDFIRQADYIRAATESNVHEITLAHAMKDESDKRQSSLEEAKDEADSRVGIARETLKEAQAKRISKAKEGISDAIGIAGSMGGKRSLSIGPSEEEDSGGSKKSANSGSSGSSDKSGKSKKKEEPKVQATTNTSAIADGADWSMSKEEFVSEWAPRLDAYLQGSALAGQGENFAKCAWKYCIDPRWSAAISNTESSKGAICIRPHNAWGWGADDSDPYGLASEWGSWAEAIDAHARGLAEGYGYTITMSGALAYCPYSWQEWYNNTLGEMAQI